MSARDEMAVIEHRGVKWYAQLAERAAETAIDKIRSDEDAGPDLSLAAAAWDVVMGMASDDARADMNEYVLTDEGGYELGRGDCICPPDLLARGGFKSGCPVHA